MRRWRESDLEPFAALNADPVVMEHFPALLTRAQSDALVERIERGFDEDGFGFWALELPGEADFIGFTGLARVRPDVPFAPAEEIGWRLAWPFWGRGLASEAARSAADAGFRRYALPDIIAYTSTGNLRSRRVLERLGMTHDAREDFAHPGIAAGHRLSEHVVYRLQADAGGERK